ncbi:hypothetical protein bpr_II056 (plasmid) [Butyrivibrio proteoclasticus B316]|uniref:Uncharacterized protein n=1 Tax=Butyrivibrio proteoclasticus (strain ATCC 51982 / DSM 14932 / B316) TaxID=515622 RepID=E0S3L4_BUTPB|nr:hypothetical protein [Butyrivibrio proteoclasticus]ADL35996.1 hypothetical protein bpr_II056 [Butyrivibrio proteoclasticus B316]
MEKKNIIIINLSDDEGDPGCNRSFILAPQVFTDKVKKLAELIEKSWLDESVSCMTFINAGYNEIMDSELSDYRRIAEFDEDGLAPGDVDVDDNSYHQLFLLFLKLEEMSKEYIEVENYSYCG